MPEVAAIKFQPQKPIAASSSTTTADQTPQPAAPETTPSPAAPKPSPTMEQTAQPSAPAPSAPAPTTAPAPADTSKPVGTSGHTADKTLPKTASELPLVGLIGLLALGGALALRVVRTA